MNRECLDCTGAGGSCRCADGPFDGEYVTLKLEAAEYARLAEYAAAYDLSLEAAVVRLLELSR